MSQPIEIIVPRLGWSMEQGAFVAWHKKDGEFVRADGAGVNWRALHAGADEALVKTCGAARLEPIAAFLGTSA